MSRFIVRKGRLEYEAEIKEGVLDLEDMERRLVMTSEEITNHVRETAERFDLQDRALEVAKVASPLLSPVLSHFHDDPDTEEQWREEWRQEAVREALALIAEAERQLGEK